MGEQWKQWQTLFLGGSKITADGDCSHEIKRRLLLGRKAMINLDSILNSRDISLSAKVHLVKAMVFPVVMYGWECWIIKKAEFWRIDAFELWCWRRLLRVPWTARKSNQSIQRKSVLDIHWKDWCWSWIQYFGHLMQRTDSLEKTLMLGKTEGRRRRGQYGTRWLDDIADSVDMSLRGLGDGDGQGGLVGCSHGSQSQTRRSNWRTKRINVLSFTLAVIF